VIADNNNNNNNHQHNNIGNTLTTDMRKIIVGVDGKIIKNNKTTKNPQKNSTSLKL